MYSVGARRFGLYSMKSTILREAFLFNATAIIGPLLFLGGAGYLLDRYFGTNKKFVFFAIGTRYVVKPTADATSKTVPEDGEEDTDTTPK